jgi:hypothetical protein
MDKNANHANEWPETAILRIRLVVPKIFNLKGLFTGSDGIRACGILEGSKVLQARIMKQEETKVR